MYVYEKYQVSDTAGKLVTYDTLDLATQAIGEGQHTGVIVVTKIVETHNIIAHYGIDQSFPTPPKPVKPIPTKTVQVSHDHVQYDVTKDIPPQGGHGNNG